MCAYTPVTRPYMKKGYTAVRGKRAHGRTGKKAAVCAHSCDTAVREKRLLVRTGKNRGTTVQEKKLIIARPYREKVDMAVYTGEMLTRP